MGEQKYAFRLGKNAELSLAELGALFGEKVTKKKYGELAVTTGSIDAPQSFLNRLGGSTEILEIFAEFIALSEVEPAITAFLKTQAEKHTGKCAFAINLLPEREAGNVLKTLLTRVKKSLRAEGIASNFLNNNFENVSSVFAFKQGLHKRGTNISIIEEGEGQVSLGSTVAMQDFEAYSERDYGKPFRDAQVGMLPPKLAQVMINLAHSPTIYDPFCGTGTLLMEAMLMGYTVVGSDLDARLVAGAEKNLDWLQQKFSFRLGEHSNPKLFTKNATDLSAQDFPQENFAIATEPFLGPPLSTFPAEAFLEKLEAELGQLYLRFFQNAAKYLKPGTLVVMIFPYWRKLGRSRLLRHSSELGQPPRRLSQSLIAKIEALGYSKTTFVPLHVTSLFYDRPDQVVGREIVKLVKT